MATNQFYFCPKYKEKKILYNLLFFRFLDNLLQWNCMSIMSDIFLDMVHKVFSSCSNAGWWKTLGVPVVIGGDNLPSPVEIGLTDLPNIGGPIAPLPPLPVPASLVFIFDNCSKWKLHNRYDVNEYQKEKDYYMHLPFVRWMSAGLVSQVLL